MRTPPETVGVRNGEVMAGTEDALVFAIPKTGLRPLIRYKYHNPQKRK